MKYILSVLLAFCSLQADAQKWAPLGMTWTYLYVGDVWDHSDKSSAVVTLAAEDTITIKGHLCTIIQPKGTGMIDLSNMLNTMATYEDSGRVYWYSPMIDTFTILYDFNKKVGESWQMNGIQKFDHWGMPSDTIGCLFKVIVMAVGMDTINGIPLRTMELRTTPSYQSFSGKVIEGIGHLDRPRPWVITACSITSDIAYDYFGLRCIDNGSIGFYDFKTAPYCDWKYTSIENLEHRGNGISISPNPSNGYITIKASEKNKPTEAMVYNMLGQLVYQSSLTFNHQEATLQLAPLSGVYLLLLDDKKGNVIRERIEIYE